MKLTSTKPYLLEAFYRWMVDNDGTPLLVVPKPTPDAVHGVPASVLSEPLVLNIAPMAVRNLDIGDKAVTFETRFAGQATSVYLKLRAIEAILMREDENAFFTFSPDEDEDDDGDEPPPTRPHLKIVRS